ncbi:MAG: hypothetical protein BEN18_05905 [Epulopiscium sp. Nuni2H_MBin001]|nr:MAG: hypothetical protein BEN18_05905 [Epulopiscium sp. Nuni2H_MBin001]
MKIKKLFSSILLLGMSACMVVGCTSDDSSSSDAGVIKIGSSFDLTGACALFGIPSSNAVKLAISQYNEAGGILGGQMIEYYLEDNNSNQVDAANAFKKLYDNNNIVAFIGADISGTTETIANIAKDSGIPMITPSATKMSITSIADNIFRACYIDPTQGDVLAVFATEELNATTAAVMINSESDYSVGVAEAFIESFESLGGNVLVQVNYTGSDVDFKSLLAPVNNVSPDVIIIPDYYETIANIAPQARQLGIESIFMGSDGWDGVTTVAANNPESIEGSYYINHYSNEDESDIVQNFITDYTDMFGEAPSNALAALAYDAAIILIESMIEAGTTDFDAVVEAMQNITIEGVTGTISFDENRNPEKSVSIIKIVDGQDTLYQKLNPYD